MDIAATAKAYRRRADAMEVERAERYATLRADARRAARELRQTFGSKVRVRLFGSLLEEERFRSDSDVDLAVEGLSAAEYWEAWALVEAMPSPARVDLVRLERARDSLRECILREGEVLE